jgi:uncharacterized membrane protein YgdD (TMEM256/DUF423 family)
MFDEWRFRMRVLIIAAAVCGLALVIAGAAGGHASAFGLTATSEAVFRDGIVRRVAWDSAMLLGFAHVLAALLACALPLGPMRVWAGWAFLAGVVFFSFALLAKAFVEMGGGSAPLGMFAPVGGICFMIGWVLLLVSAVRGKPAA